MMLVGSRVLTGTLVVVLVRRHRIRRSRGWLVILAVPWAADITDSHQLWDQEKRGEDANGLAMGHDAV
jgi:hypothetical protein